MSAQSSPPAENPTPAAPPQQKELQGQVIRLAVYLMLVLSAVTGFVFNESLWVSYHHGETPLWVPLLAPGLFTAFVLAYTVDRWLLVRRRHYPLSRALFQVAAALVFLTLLLPQQASEMGKKPRLAEGVVQGPAMWLLAHADGKVRASACGVLKGHYPGEVMDRVASLAQHDPDTDVRTNCELALERIRAEAN
jgi:hypothetical protein